jgi:polysaccharide deacetylase family protein (PEP-CTERM system associated)
MSILKMTKQCSELTTVRNAMTVDVEDYFQVSAFEPYISKRDWDNLPHRVEHNTNRVLDLFAQSKVRATFFTLGWVAERYPALVRRIVADGHELACHGYEHIRVTDQTRDQFRADIRRAKAILEDIGGCSVNGYRAASYSINKNNLWAHQILKEESFAYSSSIYPVKHDLYGIPDAPRFAYFPLAGCTFKEIPISTIYFLNKNMPCGGGGFFRFYPYGVSKWALNQLVQKEKQSANFYFHPWEIDPDQPEQSGISFKTRFRHYLNLNRMEHRLQLLLQDFEWDTMENVFIKNSTDTINPQCIQ